MPGRWSAVERLVDGSPGWPHLRSHGLHLLAARRWDELGRPVPGWVREEERKGALRAVIAPGVLTRAAKAAGEPLVVFKGASLATRYPDPALRPFADIDVLAANAETVHRRLRGAGFVQIADASHYHHRHHLAPLVAPDLPLVLEVHRRPEWVRWSRPPTAADLVERAAPALSGIDGIRFPDPAGHALLVAAHSWATLPLRRILDLVDLALLVSTAGRETVVELARRYRLEGVWHATMRAADAVLFGPPPGLAEDVGAEPANGTRTHGPRGAPPSRRRSVLGASAPPRGSSRRRRPRARTAPGAGRDLGE